jgi:hypothetical protein
MDASNLTIKSNLEKFSRISMRPWNVLCLSEPVESHALGRGYPVET